MFTFAANFKKCFIMNTISPKTWETIVRVAIAILSALLGALGGGAVASCVHF